MKKTVAVLFVALGLGITGCAKEPASAPHEEYFQSFKDVPEKAELLQLIGPGAKDCVHYEPAGLRISLPVNYPRESPTGVATGLTVSGDFEITMSYEILSEPEPANVGRIGTRLSLLAGWEKPGQHAVKLTRTMLRNRGSSYLAAWGPSQREEFWAPNTKVFITKTKRGRLRLARAGKDVSFWMADADSKNEFTRLHQVAFGAEDLDNVRIVGTTDDPKGALDFLVTDLRMRAASLTKVPADVLAREERPKIPAPVGQAAEPKGRLAGVLLLGLVITASTGITAWLLVRRRRHAAAVTAPAVPAAEPDDKNGGARD